MIINLIPTKEDSDTLQSINTKNKKNQTQPNSYKNIVVTKPWGYEFAAVLGYNYSVWCLKMKNKCSTSLHCHPSKSTSLCVISGSVILKLLYCKRSSASFL